MVGFVIATVLFTASFYYVVETSIQREGDTTSAETANYSGLAHSLANVVLAPGTGWYNGASCAAGLPNVLTWEPDGVGALSGGAPVGRFGMGDERCEYDATDRRTQNNLSFEKFRNLFSAKMSADGANGYVDYEEARRSLGLDDQGVDFHLRSWPVLGSVQQVLGTGRQDPNMRPLYIGTFVDTATASPPIETGLAKLNDRVIAYINITNGQSFDVAFYATLEVRWKFPKEVILHTPVLGPGEVGRLQLTLIKTGDWQWKKSDEPWVNWKVFDKLNQLATGTISVSTPMNVGSNKPNFFIEATDPLYNVSAGPATAAFQYRAFQGDGKAFAIGNNPNQWYLKVYNPDGSVFQTFDIAAESDGDGSKSYSLPQSVVGAYKVELLNDAQTSVHNRDHAIAVTTSISEYNPPVSDYKPSESTRAETAYLDLLIQKFDRKVNDVDYASPFMGYDPLGDVFPADQHQLKTWLPDVLGPVGASHLNTYTTVIVGSDVEQVVLTPAGVKKTLESWVEAGGTLIVFGTTEAHNNWLQPIYGTTVEGSAGNGLAAPDADHPILNVPNQLDYLGYIPTSEWDPDAPGFTSVVETSNGDLLTLSDPGATGLGQVVLTGWRPGALTGQEAATCAEPLTPTSQCQGLFLIHNLITITYRELYLDYGPPLPLHSASGVQTRIASVYHPELDQLVTLQLQVFVFAG